MPLVNGSQLAKYRKKLIFAHLILNFIEYLRALNFFLNYRNVINSVSSQQRQKIRGGCQMEIDTWIGKAILRSNIKEQSTMWSVESVSNTMRCEMWLNGEKKILENQRRKTYNFLQIKNTMYVPMAYQLNCGTAKNPNLNGNIIYVTSAQRANCQTVNWICPCIIMCCCYFA